MGVHLPPRKSLAKLLRVRKRIPAKRLYPDGTSETVRWQADDLVVAVILALIVTVAGLSGFWVVTVSAAVLGNI